MKIPKISKSLRLPIVLNDFIDFKIKSGYYKDFSDAVVNMICKETYFDQFESVIDQTESDKLDQLRKELENK